jgi:glutamate/tyrosine decarboxylase-like PLP-dependent enzyme
VNSISDGIFHTCHAAKLKKMKELDISLEDIRITKMVGYYTQHSFPSCEKSLKIKDIA